MSARLRELLSQRASAARERGPLPPVGRACQRCEGHHYRVEARGDFAVALLCECQPLCTSCGGKGFSFERRGHYEYMVPCARCAGLRQRIDHFNHAYVPALFAERTLSNFRIDDARLGRVHAQVVEYARSWPSPTRGLLLVGPPGLGKTHLMCGLIHTLTLEKGVRCLFKDFFLLLSEIKEAWEESRFEASILRPLGDADVLVVDELGKGRNSEWELNLLDEIVCKRYNRRKITLFTTNFPLEAEAPPLVPGRRLGELPPPETLAQRVSERVYSRLMEMCVVVRIEGEDFRARGAASTSGPRAGRTGPAGSPPTSRR